MPNGTAADSWKTLRSSNGFSTENTYAAARISNLTSQKAVWASCPSRQVPRRPKGRARGAKGKGAYPKGLLKGLAPAYSPKGQRLL